MNDIEIIIEPNGKMLIPRGSQEQNDFLLSVFEGVLDTDILDHFFAGGSEETIFGERNLCG